MRPLVLAVLAVLVACDDRKKLVQIPETIDTFQQAVAGQAAVSFMQKPALVDVLFAVDNSPSMCEKQQSLSAKFQSFIGTLQSQNLDFHIGVVATDMANATFQGKLVGNPKVLTPATPNLVAAFGQNVAAVGLGGSTRSQGLLAAQAAVTAPLTTGANAGFLRPEASLAVIFVSDEDDYSLNTATPPQPDDFVRFFQRTFTGMKGTGNEALVKLSAIVGADATGKAADCTGSGMTNAACTFHDLNGHAATRYSAVAGGTGGLVQSICASDFGPLLTTIASSIGGITRRFEVPSVTVEQALDSASVKVTVTPVTGATYEVPRDAQNGWAYEPTSQSLVFAGTGVPPPRSKVDISYVILSRAFRLTRQADVASITVNVTPMGGSAMRVEPTAQDPNVGWTYDGQVNAVVFANGSIPPAGATIDVSYRF